MARPSLADLKNRFKEKDQQKKENRFGNNGYYPFWKMQAGEEVHIRILPDADEENPDVFKIEKYEHKVHVNGKEQRISCLRQYGEECLICDRSYKYYKAEGRESEKGKYYWKNKTTLIRALILKDPLPPDADTGSFEGKVATLSLSKEVLDRVVASLSEFGDNDAAPWDLDSGFDFIIRKTEKVTPKGNQASYIGSGFSRSASSVPEKYRDDIKLIVLNTLLPKNPGLEKMAALLEAHDTGGEYEDKDSSDSKDSTPTKAAPAQKAPPAQKVVETPTDDDKPPFDTDDKPVVESKAEVKAESKPVVSEAKKEDAPAVSAGGDDDIIARIRNRNKAKG